MLFHVRFAGLLSMVPGVVRMSGGAVGVMGGLFMMTTGVMFGRLAVMTRGMGKMLLRLRMMFGCFLGHLDAPLRGRGSKASPGATSTALGNNRSEGLGICTLVDRGWGLLLEIVECEAEHLQHVRRLLVLFLRSAGSRSNGAGGCGRELGDRTRC